MIIDYSDDLSFAANAGREERPKTDSGKLHANRIDTTSRHRVANALGRSAPNRLEPSEWIWFEPEWREIHRQRRDAGITSYVLTTEINDNRSLDFKALAKIPGVKLNADVEGKRIDKTVVKWNVSFPAV
jgi:hypothetical protein